ncbi:MAG: transcription factor FapR [Synergistaceae bacterium]|nr:transcription factor FapR [Synergistaceae bacterium]
MNKAGTSTKQKRHKRLVNMLDSDPLTSDNRLALELGVSVGTIRLDREELNLPGLRERTRLMAERESHRLASIKQEEVLGEILELEPNRRALSVLPTNREYAFRHTNLIADHYIYAQAATLAIAVVREALAVIGSARAQFSHSPHVGEKLTAVARVGTHKDGKYMVSVHTRAKEQEIFVARFVVVAIETVIGGKTPE